MCISKHLYPVTAQNYNEFLSTCTYSCTALLSKVKHSSSSKPTINHRINFTCHDTNGKEYTRVAYKLHFIFSFYSRKTFFSLLKHTIFFAWAEDATLLSNWQIASWNLPFHTHYILERAWNWKKCPALSRNLKGPTGKNALLCQ